MYIYTVAKVMQRIIILKANMADSEVRLSFCTAASAAFQNHVCASVWSGT